MKYKANVIDVTILGICESIFCIVCIYKSASILFQIYKGIIVIIKSIGIINITIVLFFKI